MFEDIINSIVLFVLAYLPLVLAGVLFLIYLFVKLLNADVGGGAV